MVIKEPGREQYKICNQNVNLMYRIKVSVKY